MSPLSSRTLIALSTLALAGIAASAFAQDGKWPVKPVRFIVPFPPGGSVDPLARQIGARLNASLGQQFIVDNRTGASGAIGTAIAAKAAPDGYTFVFVFDTHAVNPALQKLPFDTVKDLAPIMLVGTAPMAIATHPAKPFKTFTDLIKIAKAKPESVSYGSVGSGSLGHLTMMLLQQAGGFKATHIPYKGGGPMTADALGGQVDLAIGSVAVLAQHIRSAKLRAIAVTGEKRSHTMPDAATLAEQGFPGFSALAWWGIFAPAGVPKSIADQFHAEVAKALNTPDLNKQLTEQLGMDLAVSTPDALQKWLIGEIARWGKVVREHNIRPD